MAEPLSAPPPEEATRRVGTSSDAPVLLGGPEDPLTPETEGRYGLRREFGRGGQAVVHLAHDAHIGRDVAFKQLLATTAERQGALMRFLREARITGQLEHPSIVPVYEVGQRPDGSLYYTQKLVRGRTLRAALDEAQGLRGRLALLSHFADVCNAVAYAHGRGVIHRDLKPENVMVGEFGETVVLDWGLAKVRGHDDPRAADQAPAADQPPEADRHVPPSAGVAQTRDGAILGTPLYMSPEQALGRTVEVDERSDVWSLGALLFELLTGRTPFAAETTREVLLKVINDAVPQVRAICPEAPPELSAIAARALSRGREERYPNAQALAAEIAAYQAGGRVRAYAYSTWELLRRLTAKNPLATVLGAAAVAMLASFAVLLWRSNEESRSHLADAFISYARAAEAEQRWGRAATYFAAARVQEERAEARFGEAMAGHLAPQPLARRVLHEGGAVALAVANGRLASAGQDGTLLLSSWPGLSPLARVQAHRGGTVALAATPDGKTIATAGDDGAVRLWETETGRALRVVAAGGKPLLAVAFSPDGSSLATAGEDGRLELFDLRAPDAPPRKLAGHAGRVAAVAFSADESLFASAGADGSARIWDRKGEPRGKVELPRRQLAAVAFAPPAAGGPQLVLGGDHGLLALWAPGAAEPLRELAGHERVVHGVAFSPDGQVFGSASHDGSVRLWEAATARPLARLDGGEKRAYGLAFAPGGGMLAVAHQSGAVRVWRLAERRPQQTLVGHAGAVSGVAFSADNRFLASASLDGTARLWDRDGRSLRTFAAGEPLGGVALSADGALLAASGESELHLFQTASGEASALPDDDGGDPTAVAFSPAGRELAVGTDEGELLVYDLAARRARLRLSGPHLRRTWAAAWSPDGALLAAADASGYASVFDAASGELRARLGPHGRSARALAFSPDGKLLATGGNDDAVLLWDLARRARIRSFGPPEAQVRGLTFSPDGRALAVALTGRAVKVFETASGELLARLGHHEAGATGVAWSPDGKTLATASTDRLIELLAVDGAWALPPPQEALRQELQAHGLLLQRLQLLDAPR